MFNKRWIFWQKKERWLCQNARYKDTKNLHYEILCALLRRSKQFSQHPKSPGKLRRQINLVRIPEEPVNYLHYFVQTSFGSPVKILALSLPINRLELEARHYLLQTFPCDEFYLRTLTCLHNTLYMQKDTFYVLGPFHVEFDLLSTFLSL
jgi:hypothetical protein